MGLFRIVQRNERDRTLVVTHLEGERAHRSGVVAAELKYAPDAIQFDRLKLGDELLLAAELLIP